MTTSDPRAVSEYRIAAVDLKAGDLVNLSPGEDDWQQVLSVYAAEEDLHSGGEEVKALVGTLGGRYVLVELTDLAPVDNNVYFEDGHAMTVSPDGGADELVSEVISGEYGVRSYLYTKFELVTIRS